MQGSSRFHGPRKRLDALVEMNHLSAEDVAKLRAQNNNDVVRYPPRMFQRIQPSMVFHLLGKTEATFWSTYCQAVEIANKRGTSEEDQRLFFSERCIAGEALPLRIEVSFRFQLSRDQNANDYDWKLSKRFIVDFVDYAQKTIEELMVLSDNREELLCCVLEKDPVRKNIWVDLHLALHFPFCRVDPFRIHRDFLPTLARMCDARGLISHVFVSDVMPVYTQFLEADGQSSNIVSMNTMIQGSIPLLCSVSKLDDVPYRRLVHIFRKITDELRTADFEQGANITAMTPTLEDVFIPEQHPLVKENFLPIDTIRASEHSNWLPLFLSTGYGMYNGATRRAVEWKVPVVGNAVDLLAPLRNTGMTGEQLFRSTNPNVMNKMKETMAALKEHDNWFTITDNGEPWITHDSRGLHAGPGVIEFILDKLNPQRVASKSNLEAIAAVMVQQEVEDGMTVFMNFCRRNPVAFSALGENYFSKIYTYRMGAKNSMIGQRKLTTLLAMFRQDDNLYYHMWWLHLCDYYILNSLEANMGQLYVAQAFYFCYILNFLYSPSRSGSSWYKFHVSRWVEDVEGGDAEACLIMDFRKNILSFLYRYKDDRNVARRQTEKVNFQVLLAKLANGAPCTGYMSMLKKFYREPRFEALRDSNFYLTACNNRVIDTTGGALLIREGYPDDYITKCTNIDVCQDYTMDHPDVEMLTEWIHQMFNDKDTERAFWLMVSSILEGGNRDKSFNVFYGKTGGGKSNLADLMSMTLGEYFAKMPITFFMEGNNRSSGAAQPELRRAVQCRLLVCDEGKKGSQSDASLVKLISGNDKIYVRGLFESGGDFRPQFKVWMLTNHVPEMDDDTATRARLWIWYISATWTLHGEVAATPEEQDRLRVYKADKNFDSNFERLAPAMLWLACHFYATYKDEGLQPTELIRKCNRAHWRKSNPIRVFFRSQCIPVDDDTQIIPMTRLYNAYSGFLGKTFPDRPVPDMMTFLTDLVDVSRVKTLKRDGGLKGYRLDTLRILMDDDDGTLNVEGDDF